MSIEQHIEELRAELRGSILSKKERKAIEAELEAALKHKAGHDAE